ncbi:ribonuclease P protein component [Miniphocaeibacter massiliensis]|uniref:ribonuclease P protein component n=1 Tax=Miniphocaeibacter massiliensis TaxID=2041841 RepID=UPI000C1C6C27|nr:ribonuclease P protein component [Miniphocaeibacter massiliensis]
MEKEKRLRSNRDFRKVYKKGKGYFNKHFTIIIRKNKLQGSRVGFSITKKHGNAVERNKLKRRLKEIVRHNFNLIKEGYDIVVIPKQNTKNLSYQELEKSATHLLKISFKR